MARYLSFGTQFHETGVLASFGDPVPRNEAVGVVWSIDHVKGGVCIACGLVYARLACWRCFGARLCEGRCWRRLVAGLRETRSFASFTAQLYETGRFALLWTLVTGNRPVGVV